MTVSEETIVGNVILELMKKDFLFHHRKMWNWIADQTLKLKRKVYKEEYFDELGIPKCDRPLNLCYCCDFAKVPLSNEGCEPMCQWCPVDWMSNDNKYMCKHMNLGYNDGLIMRWEHQYGWNYKDAARLARIIANLPEAEQ